MGQTRIRVVGSGLVATAIRQLVSTFQAEDEETPPGELILCAGDRWRESLPDENGERLPVLVLACSQQDLAAAAQVGSDAIVWYGDEVEELYAAVRCAVMGQRYLSSSLVAGEAGVGSTKISARTAGVVRLAARGCSNKQIARDTGLSIATVEYHLARAFTALDVKNRVELAARAHLLPAPSSGSIQDLAPSKVQGKP